MVSEGIRVTVEDLETGETETVTVVNDWYLLTVGDRYLASSQHFKNGTSVLTVKRDTTPLPAAEEDTQADKS